MNRLKGIRGFQRFNIVSIPIYLIIIACFYLGWKYLPVYWQRENLIEVCQNSILAAHRGGPDAVTNTIMEQADLKLGLKLKWDDISVQQFGTYFKVQLNYLVRVKHVWGGETVHWLKVKTDRKVIDY